MENNIKLIVGLGNPGLEYARTRHNVGFWLLDLLAEQNHATFKEGKFFGLDTKISTAKSNIFLLKPTTFMNLSGKSVSALANFYKISAPEILVVHDDLDLPLGVAKIKLGGGTGGHNGLADIVKQLGNDKNFYRLRVGIGRPNHKNIISYVLGAPSATELADIESSIDNSINIMPYLLNGEIEKAMQKLHTKN